MSNAPTRRRAWYATPFSRRNQSLNPPFPYRLYQECVFLHLISPCLGHARSWGAVCCYALSAYAARHSPTVHRYAISATILQHHTTRCLLQPSSMALRRLFVLTNGVYAYYTAGIRRLRWRATLGWTCASRHAPQSASTPAETPSRCVCIAPFVYAPMPTYLCVGTCMYAPAPTRMYLCVSPYAAECVDACGNPLTVRVYKPASCMALRV